ncbi:MAG: hypothetical protein V1889_02090 [archaeon]
MNETYQKILTCVELFERDNKVTPNRIYLTQSTKEALIETGKLNQLEKEIEIIEIAKLLNLPKKNKSPTRRNDLPNNSR